MGDSHAQGADERVKFDAASFILAGETRNRTNKQKQTNKITNSKRYTHTLPIRMRG